VFIDEGLFTPAPDGISVESFLASGAEYFTIDVTGAPFSTTLSEYTIVSEAIVPGVFEFVNPFTGETFLSDSLTFTFAGLSYIARTTGSVGVCRAEYGGAGFNPSDSPVPGLIGQPTLDVTFVTP
jgi:hypothetical protein